MYIPEVHVHEHVALFSISRSPPPKKKETKKVPLLSISSFNR